MFPNSTNTLGIPNTIDYQKHITVVVPPVERVILGEKRKGDLWYFVCDYKKAKKEFGWEPKISVDEGLKKICKWIEENKELFK